MRRGRHVNASETEITTEREKIMSEMNGTATPMVDFVYCPDLKSAEPRQLPWDRFAGAFAKSKEYGDKAASVARAGFIGGQLVDERGGRKDNVESRTIAVLDYDKVVVPLDAVESALEWGAGTAAVAYSTYRHTPDAPRLRVVVPLDRAVGREAYREVVNQIAAALDIGTPDACSYTMNQLMFLPSHAPGVEPYFCRVDGPFWAVGEAAESGTVSALSRDGEGAGAEEGDDGEGEGLLELVAQQPLDLTGAEVDLLLENYEAEGLEYDDWARVGMALHHQYGGGEPGYRRWLEWSEKSTKHDDRQMPMKWRSFGSGSGRLPATLASVIKLAGGRDKGLGATPGGGVFARLKAAAAGVDSSGAYLDFVQEVRGMGDRALPEVLRAELRTVVHKVFAKAAGMTIGAVKKDMAPSKKTREINPEGAALPDWAADWVYCEEDARFERVSVRHSVTREAFRTVYDRMPEVVGAATNAVEYLTQMCGQGLESVASKMYWPGEEKIFRTTDGLKRLNTYVVDGIAPAEGRVEDDADGGRVVELFMGHLEKLVPDDRERRLLIDFLAHVYQNPGQRVQWALLLYGVEGNGKSYVGHVMHMIMGSSYKTVSTTAINSEFTSWAEGAVLSSVEEVRISGVNKYAVLDKLKPIISNDVIAVVGKGANEKQIPNFSSWMMTTNHADAIPASDNDRRLAVITTAPSSKAELLEMHGGSRGVSDYFHRLFAESDRRADALARMLRDWEISDEFDAKGRAPETVGLDDMRDANVSEDRAVVEDAIEQWACEVIGKDMVDVTHLNDMVTLDGDAGEPLPVGRALAHVLMDLGYKQVKKRRWKINGRVRYFWMRRGGLTENELRAIATKFHGGGPDRSRGEKR